MVLLKKSEHNSYHSKLRWENEEYRKKGFVNLERTRPLTKQWHASEEGRKWHSEHWKTSIGLIKPKEIDIEETTKTDFD